MRRQREQGTIDAPGSDKGRLPTVPPHLTAVAKAEWTRMGRLLRRASLLTDFDTIALAAYCSAYARHVEAEAMLNGPVGYCPNCKPLSKVEGTETGKNCQAPFHVLCEYGMVLKNRKGAVGSSPYVAIDKQAISEMRQFLTEFGMTPASRSRMPKPREQPSRSRRSSTAGQDGNGHIEQPPDARESLGWPIQVGKN